MKFINQPLTVRGSGVESRRLDPDHTAVLALAFISEDADRIQRFLALTGFDPQGLRAAATEPGFTRAILSYLSADEGLLIAFATSRGLNPEAVGRVARAAVEGPPWDDGGL